MSRSGWSADLLDLVLPSGCAACRAWVPDRSLVCIRCRTRLREPAWPRCDRCHHPLGSRRPAAVECLQCSAWPSVLTVARYAYVLEPPADDLVHGLKYEGWPELAALMGESISRALTGLDFSMVVPVPTTERRKRERGYNQAELLAEVVARRHAIPLVHALARVSSSGSQTSLAPDERRENVRGAFRAIRGATAAVSGARVVLVDDVLTTGATAAEVAETLSRMGAESVSVATFARALPTRRRRAA